MKDSNSRTRDASRNYKLKSAKTEHSLFINTPKIWNKLPSVIKDAQSLESFKIAIRKHYQSSRNITPEWKPGVIPMWGSAGIKKTKTKKWYIQLCRVN